MVTPKPSPHNVTPFEAGELSSVEQSFEIKTERSDNRMRQTQILMNQAHSPVKPDTIQKLEHQFTQDLHAKIRATLPARGSVIEELQAKVAE